jgi:hypothetical protein
MGYTLNSIDLSTYGIIPTQAPGSNLALEGFLSMPERINKTEHSWGDANGVEPYVSPAELFWGGRDLTFHGILKAASRDAAETALMQLYAMLDSLTGLTTLACDWGSWQVYVKGQIDVTYLGAGVCTIRIPFREPVVDMTGGVIPASGDFTQVAGIDGVDFEDLGFTLVSFEEMGIRANRIEGQLHRPAPKSPEAIGYEQEAYQVTKTEARKLQLKGVIQKASYAGLAATVRDLYALFSQPGTRMLYIPEDKIRIVFAKNGFQIRQILGSNTWTAELHIQLTESGEYAAPEDLLYLVDTVGNYVTTTVGQKILVKL